MTYALTVLYHHPQDPEAFDRHYAGTHAPLAARMPGLRSYTSVKPAPGPDGTPPQEYLVATLVFDDQAAFGAAVGSEEGRAAVADVPNFASGGAEMLTGEVVDYL